MHAPTKATQELVAMVREDAGDGDPKIAADKLVADLPPHVTRRLASAYLVQHVDEARRRDSLGAERRAVVPLHLHEGSTPSATPTTTGRKPRPGTASYARWIESTDEGRAYDTERREWEHERTAGLIDIIEEFTARMRVSWTEELLSTTFALGDGSEVTWGEATVEQHQLRLAIFSRNAVTNLEGAARHQQAIDELTTTGTATLHDLVRAAA